MDRLLAYWRRLEGRYTYRIPTAALTVSALIIATGLWAAAGGGGASVENLQAGNGRQANAAGVPYTGEGSEFAGDGTPGVDANRSTVSSVPGRGTRAAGAPSAQAPTTAPGAPGSGEGAATQPEVAGSAACPEGLDKGDCTGVTPDVIRIGTHAAATQCGTEIPDTSDPNEAEADDWIEYINQVEGGVHGRKLEPYDADDGYCPEMAGQAANQLIDEYRVFAVQGFLGVDQNRVVAEKAQSRSVPYIAGGGPMEWAARWSVFHQNQSSYDVMYPAVLKYIVGSKGLNMPKAKIGMMYVDTPDVKDPTLRSFKAVPQANVAVKIPLSDGIKQNFLEEIRQMQAAGVEVVYCNCHPLNMVAFVQQADAQQFKPQYTFVSQGADLDVVLRLFPGDSTWAKNVKGLSNFCHQTHPCSKPYEAKLKQVKPDAIMSQLSLVGIHAIEMFAEPMRRVGPDLSRARYVGALQGLEGWTTGLTAPIDLSPDRSVGAMGFAVYSSPGTGSRNYQMVDVDGQAYRSDWS
jgi:branched-chain amino acid transport system substrate-binding protein